MRKKKLPYQPPLVSELIQTVQGAVVVVPGCSVGTCDGSDVLCNIPCGGGSLPSGNYSCCSGYCPTLPCAVGATPGGTTQCASGSNAMT